MRRGTKESADWSDPDLRNSPTRVIRLNIPTFCQVKTVWVPTKYYFAAVQNAYNLIPWGSIPFNLEKF